MTSSAQQQPQARLIGFAQLPAETYADGPPTRQFNDRGVREARPRFPSPVVQGFSGVQFGRDCDSYWVVTDNGFGSKQNSPDHLLRLYRIAPEFETTRGGTGTVRVLGSITLRDPQVRTPFLVVREFTDDRFLTGADYDPESLVLARDGTFWIGDEFGPFLLHIDGQGVLMEPPYPTPDTVRSPQHPGILAASPQPGTLSLANLRASRGFEGMAADPVHPRLWLMLEGTVAGDAPRALRIYEFNLNTRMYSDTVRHYALEDAAHSIGDLAAVNDHELLVIERDNAVGDTARFKRIYRIDTSRIDAQGFVAKELLVDLLTIANPDRLGGFGTTFRFPFETIEGLLVLDPSTLLVINDNNYRSEGGRGAGVTDRSEVIVIRLSAQLELAPGVGRPSTCGPFLQNGSD